MEREELIKLFEQHITYNGCEAGIIWALLKAGAEFAVENRDQPDRIKVHVYHKTFDTFENDVDHRGHTSVILLLKPSVLAAVEDPSVAQEGVKVDYTRDELIAICERAVVPQDKWYNRDSPASHEQLGACWAALKRDAPFEVLHKRSEGGTITDFRTIWLRVDGELRYLPTPKRLEEAKGGDWY